MREPIRQRLAVEPEPSSWPAQADAAELDGVLVDPVALDAEKLRDMGSVDKPRSAVSVSARTYQLGDPLGDLLDVIGI